TLPPATPPLSLHGGLPISNCITPLVEVMHRWVGVERAMMTTVHAYTGGQRLADGPHRRSRRGRAAVADLDTTQDVDGTLVKVLRSEEHTSELQSRFDLVCR